MKLRLLLICLLCSLPLAPQARGQEDTDDAAPYWSGLLAELVPGAGYFYNGNVRSGLLGATLTFPIAAQYYSNVLNQTYAYSTYETLSLIGHEVYSFTVYDSYQDALDQQGRPEQLVDIPHYSMGELFLSPFEPELYTSWKLWPGLAIALTVATYQAVSAGISPSIPLESALFVVPAIFAESFFIGMGEEAEFRGFQFPAFSKLTHSVWAGGALSSLSFGLSHLSIVINGGPYALKPIFYATGKPYDFTVDDYALAHALYTAGFGAYAAWLTASDKDGIRKAILLHGMGNALYYLSKYLSDGRVRDLSLSASFPLPL